MKNKLPHAINTEDLLKALETADDTIESISFKNDVPMFLSKFKLESGNNFIRPSLLYKLYKIYSQEPVSIKIFSRTCADFIPRTKHHFKLNISPVKLTKILNPPTNHNQTSSASIKNHYEAFIKNDEINKGDKWVEGFMFFEIYRFHCIDSKIMKRLRYEHFIVISKMYFDNKRIGSSKGVWFKLCPSVLEKIPPEHQQKVRNGRAMSDENKLKRKPKEG